MRGWLQSIRQRPCWPAQGMIFGGRAPVQSTVEAAPRVHYIYRASIKSVQTFRPSRKWESLSRTLISDSAIFPTFETAASYSYVGNTARLKSNGGMRRPRATKTGLRWKDRLK